jgi:hypothetical protein
MRATVRLATLLDHAVPSDEIPHAARERVATLR